MDGFCSFWYFKSNRVFRDDLFINFWNRIQWLNNDDNDGNDEEKIKILCLFYLLNDIGRINGKSITPIDYYPVHNILPTTKKNMQKIYKT